MHTWEFEHRGEPSLELWSWRALNPDGSLHTRSRQQFDSFTKAFENAKSHGLDQAEHQWNLAVPRGMATDSATAGGQA
jgi:hypothetical protein